MYPLVAGITQGRCCQFVPFSTGKAGIGADTPFAGDAPMTSEGACIICGKWPEKDRWALREMLDTLPIDMELICDECVMAWARNVGFPVGDDGATEH
ncbi:MAG: hypothetical protein QOE55_6234 [Acidobacteriaceae bacterium]|jgi:hypothetical protein|nr:hypothetical protein [Acidobacteriaceae bacterium]